MPDILRTRKKRVTIFFPGFTVEFFGLWINELF